MKIIKRYQNRKLYDTDTGEYVTVLNILALAKGSFVVIDNKTKTDITTKTVWTAVFESGKLNNTFLEEQVFILADKLKETQV